jgi:hypothetical protein
MDSAMCLRILIEDETLSEIFCRQRTEVLNLVPEQHLRQPEKASSGRQYAVATLCRMTMVPDVGIPGQ